MASAVLLPSGSPVNVKVHPVVIFAVCDAYTRRKENQERVIGSLLGTVAADGTVEVKNCYVVPHTENAETVAVDLNHHKTMLDLHNKVTTSEVLVGWFATGPALYQSDALIQEFYSKESNTSVHLLVDTTLQGQKFTVQAYTSRQLSIKDKPLATEFVEVPSEVLYTDIERVGAELMVSPSAPNKALSDAESLPQSLERLVDLVEKVAVYVDQVAAGKVAGDPSLGRYLADTLAMVPHFAKADFEKLFNDSVQDSMMASYLSNMLRAQIALAEKLYTASLPLL